MSEDITLDQFMRKFLDIVEKGEEGEKILRAAQGGTVQTERYHRDVAPGYDEHLRELAIEADFAIWNIFKRPATLAEIYNGVGSEGIKGVVGKVHEEMSLSEWPRIWLFPSKRTSDRRVNECASSRREFWGGRPFQPLISTKPGEYRPHPLWFAEDAVERIKMAAER